MSQILHGWSLNFFAYDDLQMKAGWGEIVSQKHLKGSLQDRSVTFVWYATCQLQLKGAIDGGLQRGKWWRGLLCLLSMMDIF